MSGDTFDSQPAPDSEEELLEQEAYAEVLRDLFTLACREFPDLKRQIEVSEVIVDPVDRTTLLMNLQNLLGGFTLRILIEGKQQPMKQTYGVHVTDVGEYAFITGRQFKTLRNKLSFERRQTLTRRLFANISEQCSILELFGRFDEIDRIRSEIQSLANDMLHGL